MSTTNLKVNLITYKDITSSNNPAIRAHDLTFQLMGLNSNKPNSEELLIEPQATVSVFNGTRTTSIDGTSAFDISQPDPSKNTYRFTNSAGTAPIFRTNRSLSIDNTSQFQVTVNGPLSTYTNIGGTAIDTSTVLVGDILKIEKASNFNPVNEGRFTIIAKTSTSLTVQNLNAVGETVTLNATANFLVYSNGTIGNQVQIDDKVVISAGFSQVTFGTYSIEEVAPLYFEVSVAYPNGIPLESGILPTASGMIFYSAAKAIVLIAAQDKCAVQFNGDSSQSNVLEPVEVGNPEKPGLLIKQGTAYSLSIKNLSLAPLTVLIASVE